MEEGGAYFGKPEAFALNKYNYYMCCKCDKPYFGGERDCGAGAVGDAFDPVRLSSFFRLLSAAFACFQADFDLFWRRRSSFARVALEVRQRYARSMGRTTWSTSAGTAAAWHAGSASARRISATLATTVLATTKPCRARRLTRRSSLQERPARWAARIRRTAKNSRWVAGSVAISPASSEGQMKYHEAQ